MPVRGQRKPLIGPISLSDFTAGLASTQVDEYGNVHLRVCKRLSAVVTFGQSLYSLFNEVHSRGMSRALKREEYTEMSALQIFARWRSCEGAMLAEEHNTIGPLFGGLSIDELQQKASLLLALLL